MCTSCNDYYLLLLFYYAVCFSFMIHALFVENVLMLVTLTQCNALTDYCPLCELVFYIFLQFTEY